MFATLVLMALFTAFITTPTLMAIHKPSADSIHTHRKLRDLSISDNFQDELQILACVHGPGNAPTLISLVESTRSTKKSILKLFIIWRHHPLKLIEKDIIAIIGPQSSISAYIISHVANTDSSSL